MRFNLTCLLFACIVFPAAGDAAEITEIPVQKGESLVSALKRIHPCVGASGVKIPPEVFADNPERVGRDGTMVLAHPVLKLPKSFLESKAQCSDAEDAHTVSAHAAPVHVEAKREVASEPVAERASEPEEEEPSYRNHLTILGLVDYSRLSGSVNTIGSIPTLVSKPQTGFELFYRYDVSSSWSLGAKYMRMDTAFEDQAGFEFDELSTVLQEFELSATYQLAHGTRLRFAAGAEQIDDLSADDDGKLLIDHTYRATGSVLLMQELARFHCGLEIVGGLGAQTFIPIHPSQADVGIGELFRLIFEQEFSAHWGGELGLLGSYERQQTPLEAHSELSLAAGLGVNFRF